MTLWQPKNSGILSAQDIKDGDLVKFLEQPYDNKGYTNVKVELPDGKHKLGSISDMSGDNLAKEWGSEMSLWQGRFARVFVKTSKTGKPYIVFYPTEEKSGLTEEEKAVLKQARENEMKNREDLSDVKPEDIPF